MGLDAYVRCNCLVEGKAKPFERPDALGIDEDGHLAPVGKWADDPELFNRFWEWKKTACEHADMEVASQGISNWSGYRRFQEAVGELGWDRFPTLRDELDLFEREQAGLERYVLVDSESGEAEYVYIACYRGVFLLHGSRGVEAGFDPDGFFVRRLQDEGGAELFRAMRIEVTENEIVDRDRGTSIRHELGWGVGRRYHVELRATTADEFEFILTPLRIVFRASIATGNPVIWC
jgi:hypothetical protein